MSEVKEVVKDVFGFQNRVSKTIIDLTLRPGKAIRDFCEGNKSNYLRPFPYLFAIIGVAFFLNTQFPNKNVQKIHKEQEIAYQKQIDGIDKTSKKFLRAQKSHNFTLAINKAIQTQYFAYFNVFLMTIFHLLVFKNMGESLKKNVWLSVFILSQIIFFSFFISFPFNFTLNSFLIKIGYFLAFIPPFLYRVWVCKQFYKISFLRSLKKNIYVYLIMILILVPTSIIAGAVSFFLI